MLFCQLTDQFPDFDDLLGIQTHGGLIQDDDLRKSKDCLRKPDPLLIPLGQVADQPAPDV